MKSARVAAVVVLLTISPALHVDIVLVRDGKAMAAIHVAAGVMDKNKPPNALKGPEREAEMQRQRLRESVKDLALYFEKISGGTLEIVTQPPAKDDRAHIYIGGLAQDVFGPVGRQAAFKQGFRMVVSDKGVGLYGESDLASSYAV